VFAALGRATHVGPHGSGQLAKLANQMIVGITIGAVAEALLFAAKGGADMAKVREAIQGGFADSRAAPKRSTRKPAMAWPTPDTTKNTVMVTPMAAKLKPNSAISQGNSGGNSK
jgi:3-hydroxyisobutyrate dehydrogenase-like beta-hydroxyacid dehydrogenase